MDNGLKKFFGWSAFIVVVILCAIFLGILIYKCVHTDSVEVTITKLDWERTIEIEELAKRHDEGWTVPIGAYNVSYTYRYRDDGFDDKDESKEKYYYYTIDVWETTREIKTSGSHDDERVWGIFELKKKEREGSRNEYLNVKAIDSDGNTYVFTQKADIWDKLHTEQKVMVNVNGFGYVVGDILQ